MYNRLLTILNLVVITTATIFIAIFSVDIKEPYPKSVIKMWAEPYIRFLAVIAIYLITLYNPTMGILALLGVLLLHLDYLNLIVNRV